MVRFHPLILSLLVHALLETCVDCPRSARNVRGSPCKLEVTTASVRPSLDSVIHFLKLLVRYSSVLLELFDLFRAIIDRLCY
jgi:hypothetical protein